MVLQMYQASHERNGLFVCSGCMAVVYWVVSEKVKPCWTVSSWLLPLRLLSFVRATLPESFLSRQTSYYSNVAR